MKDYALTATVEDELCIAIRQEAGNQYETLDFIPGRLIWGAFASLAGIRPGETPSKEFLTAFYSGEVIFASLYPVPSEGNERSRPIPLSARTLKQSPGFTLDELGDVPAQMGGGVCDWLIDGVPQGVDQEDYVRHPEFYVGAPPTCQTVRVPRTLMTQHERDNLRGVTREGRLFSRQMIPRGETFLGFLRSNSDEGDQALEWLLNKIDLPVPGKCEIPLGRSPGSIILRIEEAESSGKLVASCSLEETGFQDDGILTITCLSETLLLDAFLRPIKHLPEEMIQECQGDTLKSCMLCSHFAGTQTVQGWNGAYQRPCEEEVAIATGSAFCFLYELAEGKTAQDLVQALNALQRRGLGLRRAEGFGEIVVNDPFHRRFPNRIGEGGEDHE